MYTLENIHINPTENLFFHQTVGLVTDEESKEFFNLINHKHLSKGSFAPGQPNPIMRYKTKQLESGEWQRTTSIGLFVNVKDAVEYFKDLVADGSNYRAVRRAWHQKHGILNETNVLDETGNIVEVVHACQAHKCIRFGTCPSEGSGCATVPEHTSDGIYPIYHINTISQ
jgi:hypothetical protein